MLCVVLLYYFKFRPEPVIVIPPSKEPSGPEIIKSTPGQTRYQIPDYVLVTLDYITKNDKAPSGFVGGRTFQNRERKLPQNDLNTQQINYREWDVKPKSKTKNRGPERLVTGSDFSAYYTNNHYNSFQKIR